MDSGKPASIDIAYTGTGRHLVGSPEFKLLLSILASAKTINSHLDFYNWLQNEVHRYLPHEVLLSAWGKFEPGGLSYDSASALPGINTRYFSGLPSLDAYVSHLYRRTRSNGKGWYVLQSSEELMSESDSVPAPLLAKLAEHGIKSLLVYAMHDERDLCDCLYIFYSGERRLEVDPLTLHLIMPHLDAALRRVECLAGETEAEKDSRRMVFADMLTEREREVMYWVSEGKSNQDIGAILRISHNTVKNHLKRVFIKMGVTARSQAVQTITRDSPTTR